MFRLADPVYIAIKAALATSAAVVLAPALGAHDPLSAGFVAIVCVAPSARYGLRNGYEQFASSLVGCLCAGLLLLLLPSAMGAWWAVAPSMALAIWICFKLKLPSGYFVSGFSVLYMHLVPYANARVAAGERMAAVLVGISCATLVNVAAQALDFPRILRRRMAKAEAAVLAAERGSEGDWRDALMATSELLGDLAVASEERGFPGAARVRSVAAASLQEAQALELRAVAVASGVLAAQAKVPS